MTATDLTHANQHGAELTGADLTGGGPTGGGPTGADLTGAATVHDLCELKQGAAEIIRDTFAKLGDKWSLLILGMLDDAPLRFTVLRDSIPGISHRMLALTLRNLERDGLVSRTVFAAVPPRVEYDVTDLGRTILPTVKALASWALEHSEQIRTNRDLYDLAAESA
jgi:DNA-binding HxlR family transcriptional regulator